MTKLNLDPITVWDYTPYEIGLMAEGKAELAKGTLKDYITLAYYTQVFARQKKLSKLSKILKSIDKPQSSTGDIVLRKMAEEKGVIL